MRADQVIAPNIFDVIAEPAVVLPLVLANAMSPRTWALSARAARAADMGTDAGQQAALEALRTVIDRSFTHVTPAEVARLNGEIDLAGERARLGDRVMDHALAVLVDNAHIRARQGQARPDDPIVGMVARGAFPAYSYANVDVVHATRRHAARASRRPRGITSCLDEAALYAALCMTLPTDHLAGIVLLATPTHYTVFSWTDAGGTWFYAKNALLAGDGFRRRADADFGGDPRAAFNACMRPIDRIMSRRGHLDLREGAGSIPADEIERTRMALRRFFGTEVPGLDRLDAPLRITPPSPYDRLFEECLACRSADAVRALVTGHAAGPGPLAESAQEALAAYRWLGIRDLAGYVHAARRGPRVGEVARGLGGLDEALAVVAAVPGRESPLGDPDRICLPDEVLAFGTGSDRDRALLLHVLVEAVTDRPVVTVLAPDDAFTCVGDEAIRLSDLARVPAGAVGLGQYLRGGGPLVMPAPPQ